MRKSHVAILLLGLAILPICSAAPLPGLDFSFRIWGGDLAIRWPIPPGDPHASTENLTFLGGGREGTVFYQAAAPGNSPEVETEYTNINISGGVGLRQRFALGRYRLAITGLIRNRWERHVVTDGSMITGNPELLENTLQAACRLDMIAAVPVSFTPFPLDYALETNISWSPPLGFEDEADYFRLNGNLRLYILLLNRRSLRMYLASRTGVDYLFGAVVPMYALSSIYPSP